MNKFSRKFSRNSKKRKLEKGRKSSLEQEENQNMATKMHKIKDTYNTRLQPDTYIPDHTSSDTRVDSKLNHSVSSAKKIKLPK